MPGFGFGYRFSRRNSLDFGGPGDNVEVLYGPNYGPKGPKKIIIGVWNQGDVGYCYETNNVAENLPARWASRGINTWKPGHPDGPLFGRYNECLAAVKAAGLMMIAAPRWESALGARPDTSILDFRDLAINDPYWRANWISYQISDEIDLGSLSLSSYVGHIGNMPVDGITKPVSANFTRRVAIPSASQGSASIHFFEAFNVPQLTALSIDSYEWHLSTSDANTVTPPAERSSGGMFISSWHGDGIYDDANPSTGGSIGRRFTASVTGRAVHMQRNGPISPGRSDNGLLPVQYPPIAFNDPPYSVKGTPILPQPMAYAPGDKATGHYVATGRVEISSPQYPRSGRWQPGRFLRNESWSGFVHGSSGLYLFPQTVGTAIATGYINTANNTVVITAEPARPFLLGGAVRITTTGNFTPKGWVRRDNHQLSGTPGGAGTYALDTAKAAPIATGSAGSPVELEFSTEARPWGDDTNAENLAELTTIIANLTRMQAHPTGGNLMIDTANGGRRAFSVMRCPDINGDVGLYKEDITLAPMQPGYTAAGEPVLDDAGGAPLWEFGWPMGFEGFRVVGADGATYLYVRALSNSNRPTWFPGYAALGLPARVFGPFELVGFRRVGTGSAVEMTGSSGVLKAGVDDGPATWFYIESAALTQNEGNAGNTAYAITVRRGGNLGGSNTVTATVSGTGINPASAADFGGSFPSQVLSFAASETTKVFTVNVAGDAAAELDETFKVTLSAPSGGAQLVGSGKSELICTIANDDAAVIGAFVWLVNTLTAAPNLPGSPAGAVHLRVSETSNVTRGGVTMRSVSIGSPASDSDGFANVPRWGINNVFQGARFELPAGNWEFAVIAASASFGGGISGSVFIVDDPAGTANVRQTLVLAGSGALLIDTDNTAYTTASTAVGDAVNNLTYVPVSVSDRGGGSGVVQLYSNGAYIAAIALRQV